MTAAPPPPAPRPSRSGRLVFGGILVLLGIAWFLEATSDVAIPWDVLLPVGLILIGLALLAGSRSEASRGGLITLGVIVTIVLALGTGFHVSFGGGIGEKVVRPTDLAQLVGRYEWAIGELTIDLTEAPELRAPDARTDGKLDVELGIGQLVVIVPDGVATRVRARVSVGDARVFEEEQGGIDVERNFESPGFGSAEHRIELELAVGIGQVVVRHG